MLPALFSPSVSTMITFDLASDLRSRLSATPIPLPIAVARPSMIPTCSSASMRRKVP